MKVRTEIEPGICNFGAVVTAETEDGQNVIIALTSDCDTIRQFEKRISELSPIDAIMTLGPEENPILSEARKLLQTKGCCEACIVPAGTVKAMHVAANLSLPKDVSMSITKE